MSEGVREKGDGRDTGKTGDRRRSEVVERGRFYRRNQGQWRKARQRSAAITLCHFDKFMTAGVLVSSSLPVSVSGPLPSPTPRLSLFRIYLPSFHPKRYHLIGALSYTRDRSLAWRVSIVG